MQIRPSERSFIRMLQMWISSNFFQMPSHSLQQQREQQHEAFVNTFVTPKQLCQFLLKQYQILT